MERAAITGQVEEQKPDISRYSRRNGGTMGMDVKSLGHFLAGLILGLVIGACIAGWLAINATQSQWEQTVIRQGR